MIHLPQLFNFSALSQLHMPCQTETHFVWILLGGVITSNYHSFPFLFDPTIFCSILFATIFSLFDSSLLSFYSYLTPIFARFFLMSIFFLLCIYFSFQSQSHRLSGCSRTRAHKHTLAHMFFFAILIVVAFICCWSCWCFIVLLIKIIIEQALYGYELLFVQFVLMCILF